MGGVQSILRYQLEREAAYGIESELLVYSEAEIQSVPRVHFIGPTPSGCIRSARCRAVKILAKLKPEVAVYHGFWGLRQFADLDGATRRILVIHGDGPCMENLEEVAQWLDGILCVSEPLQASVRNRLKTWDPLRIGILPYPIQPMVDTSTEHPPIVDRPFVFGFAGRWERNQKRVERLPVLIAALDRTGIPFRFELIGSGKERDWLESKFSNDHRVQLRGLFTGADYWKALQGWDAIVYVSDNEGLPITMLEALSLGVIPVFPVIASGGDEYAGRIDPDLLYPPGDMTLAAACIARLARMSTPEIARLRSSCRAVVSPHLGDGYIETFSAFIRKVTSIPRIAGAKFPPRNLLRDLCPEAVYDRGGAILRGIRRRVFNSF